MVSLGDSLVLQILCSAVSDLVGVQRGLSAFNLHPHLLQGVPSPCQLLHFPFPAVCACVGMTCETALCLISLTSTGDKTPEGGLCTSVLAPTKDNTSDPHRCWRVCADSLHTPVLPTLYRPHSREGVGSVQLLKDTQRFAGCSHLFNL